MASGRTFRLGLQMADFILSRTSSLSARPRLGLRMADFISPRIRSLSAAKPSHFLLRARFIKAGQLQWPVCQQCGGQMARSPHSGFAWPISYYPVYGIYQRPGRAILSRARKANCNFINAMAVLSRNCQTSPICRFTSLI